MHSAIHRSWHTSTATCFGNKVPSLGSHYNWQVGLYTFNSVINQIDAQKFCFIISLFHASTCFEHMCSKHVDAWNKLIVKQKFRASNFFFPLLPSGPTLAMASSFVRFLDHTQRRITVGRTSLDEWSARRRYLYLTTHNTHNRQTSMPPLGFEPTISAGERPQTYALDRAATGTGKLVNYWDKYTEMHGQQNFKIYIPLL